MFDPFYLKNRKIVYNEINIYKAKLLERVYKMKDWGLTALYIVTMLLGFFELYRTFKFYKWDKKSKKNRNSTICNIFWYFCQWCIYYCAYDVYVRRY